VALVQDSATLSGMCHILTASVRACVRPDV
jgi:hypothetical protein